MRPEDRRRQLLDAALIVIARGGYAGVSIDAIAREAGVTRPVVYGVFDGLSPLLYALLDRQERRALRQLQAAMPTDLSAAEPDAFIVGAVRRLAETVAGDPLTWRPILLAPEGTPDPVRERIARDRELVRTRLRSMLDAGLMLRGGPKIDTEITSHALIGIAEYFGRMLVEDPEHLDIDRLVAGVESLVKALWRGR